MEYDTVDKYIAIGAPYNVKNMARVPSEKLAKVSAARRPLSEKCSGVRLRNFKLGYM